MTDRLGDFCEAHAITTKGVLRDFNRNLFIQDALQHGQFATRRFSDIIAHVIGDAFQSQRVDIAVNGHAEIPIALFPARHLRSERRLREIVDLIDAKLNLVDKLLHIDIIAPANIDDCEALARDRCDPIQAINISDRLFDPRDDLFFDILGRRALPRHGH